jgi:hypothetical protein
MKLFILLLLLNAMTQPSIPCCSNKQLELTAHNAEFVVIAKVVEVTPPPGFWSGQFAAIQIVRYEIKKSLKGTLKSGVISVGHYVVHNSCTAARSKPQLSPELFEKGNWLILFLSYKQKEGYLVRDENCGAVAYSTETVARIHGFISSN